MKKTATFTALTALAMFTTGMASAVTTNAFGNGGFETNDGSAADGWLSAASGYSISSDARTGSSALELNSPPLNAAISLQNSVGNGGQPPLIAGETASFSFWVKGTPGSTGNASYALRFLDGDGNILNPTTSGAIGFNGLLNENDYTQVVRPDEIIPVGAIAAFVEFSHGLGPVGEQPSGDIFTSGQVLIDDVVLATVPEPSSLALLGLGGLALMRRRRSA